MPVLELTVDVKTFFLERQTGQSQGNGTTRTEAGRRKIHPVCDGVTGVSLSLTLTFYSQATG